MIMTKHIRDWTKTDGLEQSVYAVYLDGDRVGKVVKTELELFATIGSQMFVLDDFSNTGDVDEAVKNWAVSKNGTQHLSSISQRERL